MKIRTLFISDMHLGEKYAQTAILAKFIAKYQPKQLYLVGDIIDGYALRRNKWNTHCTDILRLIMTMAQEGVDITYLIGNHDSFLLKFLNYNFTGIKLARHAIHTTATGTKLLVIHGDLFDHSIKNIQTLYYLGYIGYGIVLRVNSILSIIQRFLHIPPWSLAKAIKSGVKRSIERAGKFEKLMIKYTKHHQCDGIVLGHTHQPTIKTIDNINYYNCGDWIDSCSAIIEHDDGGMELIRESI